MFSRIGFAMGFFFLIHQLTVAVVSYMVQTLLPSLANQGWYFWLMNYACLYLIAFPVCVRILSGVPDGTYDKKARLRLSRGNIVVLAIMSIGIVYPLNMLTTLLSTFVSQFKEGGLTNPLEVIVLSSNPWVNLLFVGLIAPVMEEILFRGILLTKLIRFGGKTYVFFSAFLFALFHANLYQLLYAFVLGSMFATVTYYTGTIKHSILLHIIVNIIGGGVGSLLLHYGNETVMGVWGIIVLGMVIFGLFVLFRFWRKYKDAIRFEPGILPFPGRKAALLNRGMVFYMVLIAIVLVISVIM